MTASTKIPLSSLRDIAWDAWDPIGLRESDGLPDEYDTYILHVAALLKAGRQRDEAVDYLMDIESRHMGLGVLPTARERALATVDRVAGLLETLTP